MNCKTLSVAGAGLFLAGGVFAFGNDLAARFFKGSTETAQAGSESACTNCGPQSGKAPFFTAAAHATPQRTAPGDFDGDGRSDLLLGNGANGWVAYWKMSGPHALGYSRVISLPTMASVSPAIHYERIATEDFTGDGRADLLLTSGRDVRLWVTSGAGDFAEVSLGTTDFGEQIVGTGDVNGDGKADLILSTNIGSALGYWIVDGGTVVRRASGLPIPEGNPALVATGDFNGDHRVDLLWKLADSRSLVMSLGDGQSFTTAPVRDYAEGWEIWGAGDIDADGRSDFLLVNPASRLFAYWTMDGATPIRYSQVFRLPGGADLPSRFGPVAVGDYNGDGRLDLVHSRQRDGSLMMWLGDGTGFTEFPMQHHSPGWRVARSFRTTGAPVQPYVEHDATGDGRADLLVDYVNKSLSPPRPWMQLPNYYLTRQPPNAYSDGRDPFVHYPRPFNIAGALPLASGDFDGDGRLDLVSGRGSNEAGTRETFLDLSSRAGETPAVIPTPVSSWQILGSGDVNGDGRSDLLLGQNMPTVSVDSPEYRNPVMDGFAFWVMERGVVRRYSVGFRTDPAAPRLAAKGDFNGDGRLDLVWSSLPGAASPQLRMWLGDGNGFSVSALPAPAAGWDVIAAGDVDGDQRSDLILRSANGTAYWLMESTRIREYSPGFLLGTPQAVDDVNGDGRVDFVYLSSGAGPSASRSVIVFEGDGRGFRKSDSVGLITAGGAGTLIIPELFVR